MSKDIPKFIQVGEMYRKNFHLNAEFSDHSLLQHCSDTGIGQKDKIKIARFVCEELINQITFAYIVFDLTPQIKTPRERYAITMWLLYGTLFAVFEDVTKNGKDMEGLNIMMDCMWIVHDTMKDDYKDKIYKYINFEWSETKKNIEPPTICIEFMDWLINLQKQSKSTQDTVHKIFTTGRHIARCWVLKVEFPNNDNWYHQLKGEGSYLDLKSPIKNTLPLLLTDKNFRLEF